MKIIIKLLIFLFFFNISYADENPIIIISAGKNIQSLNAIGTSVNILDSQIIEDSTETFLGDIIDDNSFGTNIFQSGGHGTLMGVQLRGLEKRYTTVYIDGVKMSDPSSPDNSFYFQNITKDAIERVEILKGNQSSLYGPNAIGGTVHIFSKKGKKNQKPNIEILGGSNNTKNINYSFGNEDEKMSYFFGLSRFLTDGISARNDDDENDKFKNDGLNTNLEYKFDDNTKLFTTLRYVATNLKYDSVNKSLSDLNDKSDDIEASYSLKLIKKNNKFENRFSYSKLYSERNTTDSNNDKQNYFGYRDTINIEGNYNFNLDNKIVYGIESEFDAARYIGDYAPSVTNFKKTLNDKVADEHILSQYFDYQFRPHKNLYATFGLRNDEHSTINRRTSGRLTLSYRLNDGSKIRSSFGSGVRFPSLYDIHYADGNTNTSGGGSYAGDGYLGLRAEDLKAERANSFDIGYNKYFENYNLVFDIGYFNIEQKNPLNGDSRNNWKVQNTMGVNTSEGIETSIEWKPYNKNFNVGFNYTYTDTYDANTCNNDIIDFRGCNLNSSKLGSAKVRVPINAFNLNISHKFKQNLKNSIKIKFVDEVRDFGDINNNFKDVILEDYLTVDLKSNFRLLNTYEGSFMVKNLFNDVYEQQNGYSSLGRSFFFGLKRVY